MRTTDLSKRVVVLLLCSTGVMVAAPQGTALRYQGLIRRDSVLSDNLCDFEFRLFTAVKGGAQVGDTVLKSFVSIHQGRFEVDLDFGDVFGDAPKWLDVRAMCEGDQGFVPLDPPQPVTPAPVSLWADTAPQQIPAGLIVIWSGALPDIPVGWALCDGTNGTPDLRNRFVLSVGDAEAPGALGGAVTHLHRTAHQHDLDFEEAISTAAGAHGHTGPHTHPMDFPSLLLPAVAGVGHTVGPVQQDTTSASHNHAFNPVVSGASNSVGGHVHTVGATSGNFGWAGFAEDDDYHASHNHGGGTDSAGTHTHTVDIGPTGSSSDSHAHSVSLPATATAVAPVHGHTLEITGVQTDEATAATSISGDHAHAIALDVAASGQSDATTDEVPKMPPFFEVAFLMKLEESPKPRSSARLNNKDTRTEAPSFLEMSDFTPSSASAFVFQGKLRRQDDAVTAACDMAFTLWDQEVDGTALGFILAPGVAIRGGAFTVELDFGSGAFRGDERWIAVDVQCPGDAMPVQLSPRQPIRPVPTSVFAMRSTPQIAPGVILMWSGLVADIPAGWILCDGTNGTPDLRDRFLLDAPDLVDPGTVGGSPHHDHILLAHQHPVDVTQATVPAGRHGHTDNHSHGVNPTVATTMSAGGHAHALDFAGVDLSGGSHFHGVDYAVTATSSGGSHSHSTGQQCGGAGTAGFFENDSVPACHSHGTGTQPGHSHSLDPSSVATSKSNSHSHTVDVVAFKSTTSGGHTHDLDLPDVGTTSSSVEVNDEEDHSHVFVGEEVSAPSAPTIDGTGHLPPYYKIAFIMKG